MYTTAAERPCSWPAAVVHGVGSTERRPRGRLSAVPVPAAGGRASCAAAVVSLGARISIPRRKAPSPARSARPCCWTSAAATSSSATANAGTCFGETRRVHQPQGARRPDGGPARDPVRRRDAGASARRMRPKPCWMRSSTAGAGRRIGRQLGSMVIAYEPVWAIGTGRNATPRAGPGGPCLHPPASRRAVRRRRPPQALLIQYGGSVKPDNAASLLGQPDVDGALVGGASLKADQFLAIVAAAR